MFICVTTLERIVDMSDVENILKENTLPSLVRGIELTDGIEFDVRSTLDGELILHHDKKLAVSEELRGDLPKFVEKNSSLDLKKLGFPLFKEVINNPTISEGLRTKGKIMNIEIKLPHPSSGFGGGWFTSRKNIPYVGGILKQCSELLDNAEIPKQSVIFYGFFKHMNYTAKKLNLEWSVSSLFPNQLRFGTRKLNRFYAASEFSFKTLKSMINKQKKRGSPILPCALEYFIPPLNKLRFDRTYGLSGKPLERLLKLRKGFPIYIWPGMIKDELKLYEAGISILTDDLKSNQYSLPEGIARWTRPSTQPLNETWNHRFRNTDVENHEDLIKEATREISPWHELNKTERKNFCELWSKKWYWEKSIEKLTKESDENKLPWESVRIIGHRGCGNTPRPIFY